MHEAITDPRKLALAIAEIIETQPERWTQGKWMTGWNRYRYLTGGSARQLLGDSSCGTTACVAGWAAVLSVPAATVLTGESFTATAYAREEREDYLRLFGHTARQPVWIIACRALDLDYAQAHWLFAHCRTRHEVLWALGQIAAGAEWDPERCPAEDLDPA